MDNIPQPVGMSLIRPDARDKVTGKATFCADLRFPGMLYGLALRSKYPHAEIKGVDATAALKMPGVAAVATACDVPGLNGFGRAVPDQPVIAGDRVRFIGDVVALVAAESVEQGREALKAIKVDYEPLPVVTDPLKAQEPGAPLIWPKGNVAADLKVKRADTWAAFSTCDVVIENTYTTPMVEHAYMEIEGAVAHVDPLKNTTVWVGTQDPLSVVQSVARVLGVSARQVRVIQTVTGGGFGGKLDAALDTAVRAAVLSAITGRPVCIVYSREESFLGSIKRHAAIIRHKLGAMKDGRLVAMDIDIIFNKGAYASVGGATGGVPTKAISHAAGPYKVENVNIRLRNVHTNLPSGGAMRGYGVPQVAFACECQMDSLAAALGMDPVQLRRKNMIEKGDSTATGQVLGSSVSAVETMERAAGAAGWGRPLAGKSTDRVKYGRGISCYYYGLGTTRFPDSGTAYIFLTGEGKLRVAAGITELGQGSQCAYVQIAAQEVGCPVDWIQVKEVDSAVDPDSQSTTATRGMAVVGMAVKLAAQRASESLRRMVSAIFEVEPALIAITPQGFINWKKPGEVVTLDNLARYFARKDRLIGEGSWNKPSSAFSLEDGQGDPFYVYVFAAHVAEVEVNVMTGKVAVTRFVAAHDVGRAINPMLVEGQIQGGVSMGIGYALLEEISCKQGYLDQVSFERYLLPTALDMPDVEPLIVEDHSPIGPYGAKGIGEPPVIPAAAAINNAVYNALGVRYHDIPLTPERILAGLKKGIVKA